MCVVRMMPGDTWVRPMRAPKLPELALPPLPPSAPAPAPTLRLCLLPPTTSPECTPGRWGPSPRFTQRGLLLPLPVQMASQRNPVALQNRIARDEGPARCPIHSRCPVCASSWTVRNPQQELMAPEDPHVTPRQGPLPWPGDRGMGWGWGCCSHWLLTHSPQSGG